MTQVFVTVIICAVFQELINSHVRISSLRKRDISWKKGKKWFHPPHLLVDALKLPGPFDVVEELALVKAVVIRTVALCVIGGCQHCHLVTVDGVQLEEQLHFLCNLLIGSIFIVHNYTRHKK